MAAARSAGILLFRLASGGPEVLLIHPGGPFWRGRDAGAWQIPKGQVEPGESDEDAARREAGEELGIAVTGPLTFLGEIRQAGGKRVVAFAQARDLDVATIVSNSFSLEWPRGSGVQQDFPEVDAARWFTLTEARAMMLPSQVPLLARLEAMLGMA